MTIPLSLVGVLGHMMHIVNTIAYTLICTYTHTACTQVTVLQMPPPPPPSTHTHTHTHTHRDVELGDVVVVGQCRPLSKTVRFNVLKVQKAKGGKKQFQKF